MGQYTMANGKIKIDKATESNSGSMVPNMTATGIRIRHMEKVSSIILMVIIMKVNLPMIKLMAGGSIAIEMG